MSTAEAYRECERITRSTAANFYYGIRLLPRERRSAMCAVYAFARRVDDIGDGALPAAEKLRGLERQERALASIGDGGTDAVMVALADAYRRFEVPPDALQALIAGVRMDVEEVRYETFDELLLYCRRVAGAIGRACLAIFTLRDVGRSDRARAAALADDLGVALQLTNILRDVREDAENGRIYLPAQDLRRFGVIASGEELEASTLIAGLARGAGAVGGGPQAVGGGPEPVGGLAQRAGWMDALIRFEADRARDWFGRGIALTELLDRRSAACVLAMANIYGRLLTRIDADPRRALHERMALGGREKLWVALRSLLGRTEGGGR